MAARDSHTTARLPVIPAAELDEDLLAFVNRATLTDGPPLNFFLVLAHHERLLRKWTVFAGQVLGRGILPVRHRELLVMRTVWNCGATYEWAHHAELDRSIGFSEADFDAIKEGPSTTALPDFERLLLQAADELCADRTLSDACFSGLRQHYGEAEVLEVIFLVGQYVLVSCFVRAAGVPLEPGVAETAP